jgi:Phosphotransferase enzyme family
MAALTEPTRSVTGRGAYMWETMNVLWPAPARVERHGRAAGPRPGRADRDRQQTQYLVLPNEARPVLLLPRRPRQAAAAALRNYKASAVGRHRFLLRSMALAARVGLADALPHRITVESASSGPDGDVVSYLRKVLDCDVVVSLRIGPPRANRKPVLELLSPRGEALGFAKVGVTGLTRELVRAEAAALDVLGAATLGRLEVPRLLHHGQWRDHEVLVQAPLSGSGRAGSPAELTAAMAEVAAVQGVVTLQVSHSDYWRGLRSRLEACPPSETAGALLRVIHDLEAMADTTRLAFGSWHGDWTPWNMAFSGGRVLVWDWERFEDGVPVGFDAVHYQVQRAVTRNGTEAQAAAEVALFTAPMTLGPLGVRPGVAVFVAALYLIEIATRYLHDEAAEAGAALGDVGSWLLPTLSRFAGRQAASPRPGGVQP